MGRILAVCISEKKGTQKKDAGRAEMKIDHGIVGDAHAGNWHRQVSLLSFTKIEAFRARGADVDFGAFGENLVVQDIDFSALPVGTRFRSGGVILELTQIGKECHHHCQIFERMGDCIMPREGVFAKVLHGGVIKTGDDMELIVD
jgi:TatD DNase family protein